MNTHTHTRTRTHTLNTLLAFRRRSDAISGNELSGTSGTPA